MRDLEISQSLDLQLPGLALSQPNIQSERVAILAADVVAEIDEKPPIVESCTQPAVEVVGHTGAHVGRELGTIGCRRNALMDPERADACGRIRTQL